MTRDTAGRLLKIVAAANAILGIAVALAAWAPLSGPLAFLADLVVWPLDGAETMAGADARLLAAIGGGVLAGWAITMWIVTDRLWERDPALVRTLLLPGLIVWFCVDSTGSVLSGGWLNAVVNVAILGAFLLPLSVAAPSRRPAGNAA